MKAALAGRQEEADAKAKAEAEQGAGAKKAPTKK